MTTLIEQKSEKDIKQKRNNHTDEEIEIDLMGVLRRIMGIRKKIYKAAGIGLIIGVIIAISIPRQYTVEVTLLRRWEVLKVVVYLVWQLLSWEVTLLWVMAVML